MTSTTGKSSRDSRETFPVVRNRGKKLQVLFLTAVKSLRDSREAFPVVMVTDRELKVVTLTAVKSLRESRETLPAGSAGILPAQDASVS